ncbi:16S rRNA (cytosine(1402)-N(4))-methyltransferase RsmH [Borrelia sp. BU AG58]|uniref:16S rRNA (cytosine(1402)-N(4))-methyltransferase RsmH n=1 Tax=Borrelia sp. BU AG58 TaxID=2887345 RepID=UPI001E35FBDB|nr:16S rRNA (cytosine(1402)-N(4))-methyltransferase RsmH [Borrelia sp. BU AG58]UER67493.1 16S rRNA (cytosine(1402)-N(4))-methyltransferase RsmH [Borrelia sp. BU AG58]
MGSFMIHIPVLLDEVINLLESVYVGDKCIFVDCTLGEGGHSGAVLRKYEGISVVGIERDVIILDRAKKFLEEFEDKISYFNVWFDDFFGEYPLRDKANFILVDLGISMFHYKRSGRGFSFLQDEMLDMRLDPSSLSPTAYDIVNTFSKEKLEKLIYELGDEYYSRKIVKSILKNRRVKKIETTLELQNIIKRDYPRMDFKINPATKTFQALRIYVNDELLRLKRSLPLWLENLAKNGVLAIITFHSLEDKIVKEFFKGLDKGLYSVLTKKPIIPSAKEKRYNNASRSAKLRAVKRIEEN